MLSHHPDNVFSTRQWCGVTHCLCICAFIINNQTQLRGAGLGHCKSRSSPGTAAYRHKPILDHLGYLVTYKGEVCVTKANKWRLVWAADCTNHTGFDVGRFDQICKTTGNDSMSFEQNLQILGANRRLKRLVHCIRVQCEHNLQFLCPTQNIHAGSLHNAERMKVGRSGGESGNV